MNTALKKTTSLVLIAFLALGITFTGSDISYAKKRAKKPAKVASLKVKASKAKISVSWKKAKNAKKYQVYMKTDSGKWKKYKTVAKNKLTYTAKENATFSLKVRGINGKKKGKFSKTGKVTISCVPAIKLNTKNIEVEQGDSFTVKVSGYAAATATWNFDTSFLKANTKAGDKKKFTTKEAGSTVITVTDENGENDKKVYVTVDEVSEEDEKPKQDKDTVDFAIDGPSEITVMEGEEFTLKVKGKYANIACWSSGNSYVKTTDEYNDWDENDKRRADCTPICKYKAICPGTCTVEAYSDKPIGKYCKSVYFTINVKVSDKYNYKADAFVINPHNYTNTYFQPWAPYVGHQAIYIKTTMDSSSFDKIVIRKNSNVSRGDILVAKGIDNCIVNHGGKEKTIPYFRLTGDCIWASNPQKYFDDINYINKKTGAVQGGYVYDVIFTDTMGEGTYNVVVYSPESHEILSVSSDITVQDTSYALSNIKKKILGQVKPGMTETEKYRAMLGYIQNCLRYPLYNKKQLKTSAPVFTDGNLGRDVNDLMYEGSVSKHGNSYICLSTEAMRDRRLDGIGDSNDFWETFADCCEECGMKVTNRQIHNVKVMVDGEEMTCNPCPGFGIGYIDCTKLDTIKQLFGAVSQD